MRFVIGCALALALLSSSACSLFGPTDIYPDNPFTEDPQIQTIAVAPFIISRDMADVPSPQFEVQGFKTSDGRMTYFSTEFAATFANELTNFHDITVIQPKTVLAQWMHAEKNGTLANPMASWDQAMTVGRLLKADAILVGEVMAWDTFSPSVTIDWQLLYTKSRSTSAGDIRTTEQQGMGGGGLSVDYAKTPVYAEQLTLRTDNSQTRALLEEYGSSMEKIEPYTDVWIAIAQRPNPYFVQFAAWVAMKRAYHDFQAKLEAAAEGR